MSKVCFHVQCLAESSSLAIIARFADHLQYGRSVVLQTEEKVF